MDATLRAEGPVLCQRQRIGPTGGAALRHRLRCRWNVSRARNTVAGGAIALATLCVLASFAALGLSGGSPAAALPAQASPGMADPSGQGTGADWPAYGGTNAAWRYSPLTQIDASNVGKLQSGQSEPEPRGNSASSTPQ